MPCSPSLAAQPISGQSVSDGEDYIQRNILAAGVVLDGPADSQPHASRPKDDWKVPQGLIDTCWQYGLYSLEDALVPRYKTCRRDGPLAGSEQHGLTASMSTATITIDVDPRVVLNACSRIETLRDASISVLSEDIELCQHRLRLVDLNYSSRYISADLIDD
ncbi:hypothetical protein K474DRAFT_455358 [Panus rudis PR-1116 ss-1]|nr:hypothetical protein K474DRAFT_455358 [Panus rudis PR-1116 ss-1]